MDINGQAIGKGYPCFIIAEAGVNHNGNLEVAHQMVDVAVEVGANAIKFQTYNTEKLVTQDAPIAPYQKDKLNSFKSQYSMLKRFELSKQAFRELWEHCQEKNIIFMSTPFDEDSVDFLEALGMNVFKIPSGEITNLPFLTYIARKSKPIIASTGMSDLCEVQTAVETILQAGNDQLILLHCVSNYPADPSDMNLRAMNTMEVAFGVPVGFSDHSIGIELSLAAVALGACVIEKHFTLDRTLPGPDHTASSEPDELKALVKGIRKVELALGSGIKKPTPGEASNSRVARKSLVASCHIHAGNILSEQMIAIKRPGTGLPPSFRSFLIGRRARIDIPIGALLRLDMIE